MKLPERLLPVALAGALLLPAPAFALAEILGGGFYVTTRGSVTYESNISASAGGEDDILYSFIPSFEWIRAKGRSTIRLQGSTDFTQFSSNSEEDNTGFDIRGSAGYPTAQGSRLNGGVDFSFSRESAPSSLVNRRLEQTRWSVGTNATYRLNRRMDLRGGLDFENSSFDTNPDNSELSTRLGLGFNDILFERLGATLDYRFRMRQSDGTQNRDDQDHAILFGLTGDLFPERVLSKTDISLNFGFQTSNSTAIGEDDEQTFVLDGSIVWQARPRTVVSLIASRDVDLAPDESSVTGSQLSLNVGQTFGPKTSGSAGLSYEIDDFRNGREDTTAGARASFGYVFSDRWSARAAYSYSETDSDASVGNFTRHTATLSTSLRF